VKDLSAYINEVKRDNETLHMINEVENRSVVLSVVLSSLCPTYTRRFAIYILYQKICAANLSFL